MANYLVTVKTTVLVLKPCVAEIVQGVFAVTDDVVIVKVPLVFPAAIVIESGTAAVESRLVRLMINPPAGAAEPIVTVPVEDFPPTTVDGFRLSEVIVGGLIVKVAVS